MILNSLTITEALSGLKKKHFSPRELVDACLDRINRLNPGLNVYLQINPNAQNEADKADVSRPLGGIPLAVKDNFLTTCLPTTAASNLLSDYLPQYESTVTAKLKSAGAIILGKTNMDAWAHGSSTETSDFGPTLNPWDITRLPGGSSGGSTAAVAADMCLGAIGSETAGSIRQPAAWCSVTGFKPTYGRVSRYGVIAMASSTDSPGPITKTVADSALLLSVIAGKDPFDATSSPKPVPDYVKSMKTDSKLKYHIGFPREYLEVMDSETKPLILEAISKLESLGHRVSETSLIHPKYSIGVYTILQRSEVSSNLARFDGVRYGKDRSYFGHEAKRRIMLGTYTLSVGLYDQYYRKAQKVRALIVADFNRAFSQFDLLINPPSPHLPLKIGASHDQSMFGELQDILVEPSSIAGIPGISIPCGFVSGLPVGFGLVAPQFQESRLLSVSYEYQQITDFHLQKPRI
jgi:aspartyl-tRNA(Asn)/glutamyl-tRNA(Gln) amidotransferase subunit A